MGLPIKDGKITTPYKKLGKMWSKGYHTGIDMAVKTGTPVIAVADTLLSAGAQPPCDADPASRVRYTSAAGSGRRPPRTGFHRFGGGRGQRGHGRSSKRSRLLCRDWTVCAGTSPAATS